MTDLIFVDSAFILALINERDQHHAQAVGLFRQIRGRPMLITNAVFFEVGNSLARTHKNEAAELIKEFLISDDVEVIHVTTALLEKAIALYQSFLDKDWGLVDCISFVIMRERGVTQALTSDRHFIQAGFEALMRPVTGIR